MSKIICSAAIRGAQKIFDRGEATYKATLAKYGPDQEIGFPNTAYYLPIIYSMTGMPVAKLGDMKKVFDLCRKLIPAPVRETNPLPYLAPTLDAGMATFFVEEMVEAIKYLETPNLYVNGEDPTDGNIWLGAASDLIFRKRGVEFVDGTAPGFAAIVGAAPDPRQPRRSRWSSRRRTCMSSWRRKTTARGSRSSSSRRACRSAGRRGWSPSARTSTRPYSQSALRAALQWPSAASSRETSERSSYTIRTGHTPSSWPLGT